MNKAIYIIMRRFVALVLLCLIAVSLGGCARNAGGDVVVCNDDEYSAFTEAVSHMLPSHTVISAKNRAFENLRSGSAVEAFDAQAVSAIEVGLAGYWYPQYLATVVIAIDRDRTSADIKSWSDLTECREEVGFSTQNVSLEMLVAAIAYGLEGEGFALKSTMEMLSEIHAEGRLVQNSFEPPIVICYDYQAAAMILGGRNMETIIPSEGTLSYEKGLLSGSPLPIAEDAGLLLLDAGFRLTNGLGDPALYPEAAEYEEAARIADYSHFNHVSQDSFKAFRRSVLQTRMYSSAEGREHQLFALMYIAVIIVWLASFIHRAMQKGVRRTALFAGVVLLGWIIARLIKYQVPMASDLDRYLWFSYYIFQLALPLVFLRLAWEIDKAEGAVLPKWIRGMTVFSAALIALVMTNDLHNLVFRVDLTNPNWSSEYGYGVAYYVVLAACFGPFALAIGMMFLKGRQGLRKGGIVFPLLLIILLLAYTIGYITRYPFAWESDLTMMIGLFSLAIMETAVRCGMIPVNSRYSALFRRSPLGMRIIEAAGQTAWSSEAVMQYSDDEFGRALAAYPLPSQSSENTLLYAASITGGHVLWQEDISDINRLHREIEESVRKLEAANAVLADEERIKRAIDTENSKTMLMTQLEAEITRHTIRLSTMIEQLDSMVDKDKAAARIVLLLCYIKRRCNLFFREKETQVLPPDEMTVYFDEMAEIAAHSSVQVIATSTLNIGMSVRCATLMYDFIYNIIHWATWLDSVNIVAHLFSEAGSAVARLLLPEDARSFQMEKSLKTAIASAGGKFESKELDDAIGLSLAFPQMN